MSQNEIKNIYDSFLESGDLFEMFPNLTGEWTADKKEFSKQYEITEHLLDDEVFGDDFLEEYE